MMEENRNGEIWLDCSRCGKMFHAYDNDAMCVELLANIYSRDEMRLCPDCADAEYAEKEEQRIKQEQPGLCSRPGRCTPGCSPDR